MVSKKKIIISSIIFGIISLVLLCFIIYPLIKWIRRDSQDLVRTKKELILFETKIGEVEKSKKNYENLKTELDKINELFVDSEVPIDLIKFWEKTADDSGLLIDILPISAKKEKTDLWNSIGFSLTLTGSFPDSLRFLEKIERGSYLMEVQSFNIKELRTDLIVKVFTN